MRVLGHDGDLLGSIPDPATATETPRDQIPSILIQLSALQAALAARLATQPAQEATSPRDDPQRLLKAAEVAAMLGTTAGVVYEMARRGTIGHVSTGIVGSRGVRFTRQQVADFIRSREKSAVDSFPR